MPNNPRWQKARIIKVFTEEEKCHVGKTVWVKATKPQLLKVRRWNSRDTYIHPELCVESHLIGDCGDMIVVTIKCIELLSEFEENVSLIRAEDWLRG